MFLLISELNGDCTDPDFECTMFQGKCAYNGADTFCKCERDYGGPACAGLVVFRCIMFTKICITIDIVS